MILISKLILRLTGNFSHKCSCDFGKFKILKDPGKTCKGSLKILTRSWQDLQGSLRIFEDPQRSWQRSSRNVKDLGKKVEDP